MNPPLNKRAVSRISLGLFLLTVGVYLLFSPAHFLSSPDEEINLRTVLSFLESRQGAIPPLDGFASKTGRGGQEYAQYGLGLPLAALPWCALGRKLDFSSHQEQLNSLKEHFQSPETTRRHVGTDFLRGWMSGFGILVTALTISLCFDISLRIGASVPNAVFASLLLAFGCYSWPHGRTFFTEPLATFCLLTAFGCMLRSRNSAFSQAWILFAGLFWSYAMFIRLDSLVTGLAAVWFLIVVYEDRFRLEFDPRKITFFALSWLIFLVLIFAYNQFRFGSMGSTGYEDQPEKIQFLTPLLVGLHGFLFTPGRSLFLYSPPLIFALFGFIRFWKRDPWFAGGVFLLLAGYLGVLSKWQNWAGGYDWGPRHIYQITPFLMLVAAAGFADRPLFDRPAKRIGWGVFFVLCLTIQFLGLSADPVKIIQWFLARTLQTFPPDAQMVVTPYILQLPVYLPQFSSLALHWQWISGHGADLLIIKTTELRPLLLPLFLIPLSIAVGGGYLIWKETRALPAKPSIHPNGTPPGAGE